MHVLGCLRCGDLSASTAALAGATLPGAGHHDPEPAAWLAIAHSWHAHATGAVVMTPATWATIAEALAALAEAPLAGTFADAAVAVHGLFAAANLARTSSTSHDEPDMHLTAMPLDGPLPPTAAAWRNLAIRRLIELEQRVWQPAIAAFDSQRTDEVIGRPLGDDTMTLQPATPGRLFGSDDRVPRHLANVLMDVSAATGCNGLAVTTAAACLGAATRLADDLARARTFDALCAAAAHGIAATDAGAVLDATLFAITGAPVAVGVGSDGPWQHFAPWLPPGHTRLSVCNVLVGGARYDLELEARDGPLRAAEHDSTAYLAGAARRLCVRLRLLTSGDGMPRIVVIASRDAQTVHWLAPGEAFGASLLC